MLSVLALLGSSGWIGGEKSSVRSMVVRGFGLTMGASPVMSIVVKKSFGRFAGLVEWV